eukprot:gene25446-11109_t
MPSAASAQLVFDPSTDKEFKRFDKKFARQVPDYGYKWIVCLPPKWGKHDFKLKLRFDKRKCVLQGLYLLSKGWLLPRKDKVESDTAFFRAWAWMQQRLLPWIPCYSLS